MAPPLRQVLEVGLRSEDAASRTEAVRASLVTAETKPELRTALTTFLSGTDDNTLNGLLRGAAGDHAEEIASIVASETKIGVLRLKANSMLRLIRAGQ
jgi:hypothetical protein